jgi:sirohydrochlorin cobaltochelatase
MSSSWKHAALVLAGHGSTLNADSSTPTCQHADELRRRGLFAEVHECFWKEEPHFRDVLRQVESDTVYIVPNFISEGYFTERVLPREFGLEGPVSHIGGKTIYYTEPVGCHESMTGALLQRAESVAVKEKPAPRATCLFLVGHGTSLSQNSVKIVYHQAEVIGKEGPYAECRAAFMEQAPFIKDWQAMTAQPNVIVVPFFISDGLHSYEDIPVLLGISENVKRDRFQNPNRLGGRTLWYASAIGTEPFLADVILAQIRECDETFRTSAATA